MERQTPKMERQSFKMERQNKEMERQTPFIERHTTPSQPSPLSHQKIFHKNFFQIHTPKLPLFSIIELKGR
jgi:hypothetical protein